MVQTILDYGFTEVLSYTIGGYTTNDQIRSILDRQMPSVFHPAYQYVCSLNEIDILLVQIRNVMYCIAHQIPGSRSIILN